MIHASFFSILIEIKKEREKHHRVLPVCKESLFFEVYEFSNQPEFEPWYKCISHEVSLLEKYLGCELLLME